MLEVRGEGLFYSRLQRLDHGCRTVYTAGFLRFWVLGLEDGHGLTFWLLLQTAYKPKKLKRDPLFSAGSDFTQT